MPRCSTKLVLVLGLLLLGKAAIAWTTVGTGIEFQKFVLPDPNNVFVARMLRSNPNATIESSIAQGKLSGAVETISGQASRYDDALSYWGHAWGQRNKVVVAINGDFADLNLGVTNGGQIHSGWYCKQLRAYTGYSGGGTFAWTMDRIAFMGACNIKEWDWLTITFKTVGKVQYAQGINRSRGLNELIIFTPQYDTTTRTDNSGVEVVVKMMSPNLVLPPSGMVIGRICQIRQNAGSTPIPFDCIVLSASGTAATQLLQKTTIGGEIGLSQQIHTYETDCVTPQSFDWKETFAAVRGSHILVDNGIVREYSDELLTVRHPRTAVAYNDDYVFFVVCDGRSESSRGMTGVELGNFCRYTLGATWALNLDGGGSSTMVVNGTVVNSPSDGSERAVCNGLMMVNMLPKVQSRTLCTGQYVVTTNNANVRLGPGTNYGVWGVVAGGTQGIVVEHPLNGVRAKGYYWWNVDFGGTLGWIAESLLRPEGNYPPTIIEHPVSLNACAGSSPIFSVSAVGSGCLNYQWRKNGATLYDGADYSGTTTKTLTVLNCGPEDIGNYDCVVTNNYGTAYSSTAVLDVKTPVTVSINGPSVSATRNGPVSYTITYSGANSIVLAPSQVRLNRTGNATAFISVTSSGETTRTVTLTNITGNGTISISLIEGTAANDYCLAPAVGPSAPFIVDNNPPTSVSVSDEGNWTPSLTTLRASWTASSDGEGSGVYTYQYSVQTQEGVVIRPWSDIGNVTFVEDSLLNLSEGTTYIVSVRAVDRAGNIGQPSSSDGILVAPVVNKIGLIWDLANFVPFSLRGKLVTSTTNGAFWIEEDDRSAGIKVISQSTLRKGNRVNVAGILTVSGTQRVLMADVVENLGGTTEIRALGLRLRDLGGKGINTSTPGVATGRSAYNIGLLVRCWGYVKNPSSLDPNNKFFYIDDGSLANVPCIHMGVLVRCGQTAPPMRGL
jgi:hypothetical protein